MGENILIGYWPLDTIHVRQEIYFAKRYTSMISLKRTTLCVYIITCHEKKSKSFQRWVSRFYRGDIACCSVKKILCVWCICVSLMIFPIYERDTKFPRAVRRNRRKKGETASVLRSRKFWFYYRAGVAFLNETHPDESYE